MAESDDVIDITTQRLRRNAIASHRKPPAHQRAVNWLDFTTSNLYEFFSPSMPPGPRVVRDEMYYMATTALHGAAHYIATQHFLHWNPFAEWKPVVKAVRPDLRITVFDRDRERTPALGQFTLVT